MTARVWRRECAKRHEGVDRGMNKLKRQGAPEARRLATAVESH